MEVAWAKAHAYGNDFLYRRVDQPPGPTAPEEARRICHRHTGIGADGVILFRPQPGGARMWLLNADGSAAEVSGNGVRGLAAWLAFEAARRQQPTRDTWTIETDAGPKHLVALGRDGLRFSFAADMGAPSAIESTVLDVEGESVDVVVLNVGNPQCVVIEPSLDETRYRRLAPALERHRRFPQHTNVEFVVVDNPGQIRILIWERGVGPTSSSGTGACASAVAAIVAASAERRIAVSSLGGTQTVEWHDKGLTLSGWADVVGEGVWQM